MADDQGRLAGDAQAVLVQCLGRHMRDIRVDQIEDALAELEAAEVLQRYSSQREPYLQLLGWWRWQNSQRRAYPSRWPPPKGWHDLVYGCAAAPELQYFEDALNASPRRNAAIRGNPLQSAAKRGNPLQSAATRAAARAAPRAGACRAVPGHADKVARAPEASGPRGGAPQRAGEVLSEFQARVPRPGFDA